jgi:hypothetical protein
MVKLQEGLTKELGTADNRNHPFYHEPHRHHEQGCVIRLVRVVCGCFLVK